MSSLNINEKYQPLWTSKTRYFVVTGGRGSSKSFSVTVRLLNLTYEEGHTILFSRYTMMSAHTSIIPEFVEKIEMMGLDDDFRITKDEVINLTTGSKIIFKGIRTSSGNQTAALKSLNGVTTFVLDEGEELVDETQFDKIDLSVRVATKQNRVIVILNPTTKEHWIYRRFFEENKVDAGSNKIKGDVTYIHTTYKDNKSNLDESFLKRVYEIKKHRPDKYYHQILGGWLEKAEGVIFTNWEVGEFKKTELMCYGQDFGYSNDPTTLVHVSVNREKRMLWVKEMYNKVGLNTSATALENKKHAGVDLIICDSSEPRLITELKGKGCNMKPTIKREGSILSGIELMKDFDIVVDPKSHNIIKELNNYAWKEKKEVPIDDFNHNMDAIRYALDFLIKGRRSGQYVIR